MTTIYLVRHGQASFGRANYDQLSDLGHRQSLLLGQHFARTGVRFDGFFCGEMARQRGTALRVIEGLGLDAQPAVHPGFNEYDFISVVRAYLPHVAREHPHISLDSRKLFGDAKAFQEAFEKCIALWTRAHQHDGEPIETWARFCERALEGLRAVATQDREAVFVATSGGVIAAALREALALTDDTAFSMNWRVHNASVHRFRLGRRGLSLLSFNEVAHLELAGEAGLLTFR